jgi:hypothetical protein
MDGKGKPNILFIMSDDIGGFRCQQVLGAILRVADRTRDEFIMFGLRGWGIERVTAPGIRWLAFRIGAFS